MKETELKMRPEDQTPFALEDKEKKKVLKELVEISSAIGFLHEQLKNGEVNKGFVDMINSNVEHHFIDLCKMTGYASHLEKEKEERHREIRSLNEQNRALRVQLGEKVSGEDAREFLKNATQRINTFWDADGLGYIKDIKFTQYGAFITFSMSFTGIGYKDTEEEHLAMLRERYDFCQNDDRNTLLFTEENVKKLTVLFANVFGYDMDIDNIESGSYKGEIQMKTMTICVRDYDRLASLDYPTYGMKK